MATILGFTSQKMSPVEKEKAVAKFSEAISTFYQHYSVYLKTLDQVCSTDLPDCNLLFDIYVPPATPTEKKQLLVETLCSTARSIPQFGEKPVTTLFKYHEDSACGVDGKMRSDT